jgi:hypothetical protein
LYSLLHDHHAVSKLIKSYPLLSSYPFRILEVLQELKPEFDAIAAERKAENVAKLKAKKEAAEIQSRAGAD